MLPFEEGQFPESFVGLFIYILFDVIPERSSSYSELQQETVGGFGGIGDSGWRKAYFSWCKHSNKCPESASEHHAGSFLTIQEIAALKWSQTFTFALLEHPRTPKRENVKWSKEEWEGLEEAFVWFITKETSRTKLFQMELSVKLAQRPA